MTDANVGAVAHPDGTAVDKDENICENCFFYRQLVSEKEYGRCRFAASVFVGGASGDARYPYSWAQPIMHYAATCANYDAAA